MAHVPLYTTIVIAVAGIILVRDTRCVVAVAENLYQTSSSTPVAEQVGTGKPTEAVALVMVPLVNEPHNKSGLTAKLIAPIQLSFVGGGGGEPMHKLNEADSKMEVEVVKILKK